MLKARVVVWLLSHVQLFFDLVDCSPPGSSVHGILQARKLEWVAISFSRGSSWARDQTHVSCIDRWVLHQWATREACCMQEYSLINFPSSNLCLRIGFWENLPVADGTRVVQESKCKDGKLRLFHSPLVGPGNSKTADSWSANSPRNVMENSAIVRTFPWGKLEWYSTGRKCISSRDVSSIWEMWESSNHKKNGIGWPLLASTDALKGNNRKLRTYNRQLTDGLLGSL